MKPFFTCTLLLLTVTALAEMPQPQRLPEVVVLGEPISAGVVQAPFLPDVRETHIFSGKKASVLDFDAVPTIVGSNYRQALAQTPGLLISEETTPLVSLGYRGIGEPNRTQFMNVLSDEIPIHADPFGYPEAYYTPPLDGVDRVEFVRGGASLMYGPQPGGSLNYITNQPRKDKPFSFVTQQVFGSDDLFASYNAFDGTSGRVGYLGYFNHRESQGLRAANSDYELNGGSLKLVLDAQTETRWGFNLDAYEEAHGEPGDLTYAQYQADRNQTVRQFDEFRLRRYVPSVSVEHDFSENTLLTTKAWGGYYERWSGREQAGANPRNIQRQEFYTYGLETRVRQTWDAWEHQHTLAGGFQFYGSDSPRTDTDGASLTAESGVVRARSQRDVLYGSFFLENKFALGRFSVTPGFRLENIHQSVTQDNFNASGVFTKNQSNDKIDVQPLVALSLAYQATDTTELYASVAQSYRTTIFTQSLLPPVGLSTNGDIAPSVSWTYEAGYRGRVEEWLTFDTSLFLVDLDDKYGTAGGIVTNVGRSLNYGWDGAVDLDVIKLYDRLQKTDFAQRFGSVSLYANFSVLEAKIHGGLADNNTPQYAPDFILRTGLNYRFRDKGKISLSGTFVDHHFAQDINAAANAIPGYMVWDLTGEWKVYKEFVTVIGGINNLLDEDYYSRVRGTSIDPAYGRNVYAGIRLTF